MMLWLASRRGAQPLDLLAQPAVLDGARHDDAERLALDRLGDEVVGAGADRADRGLERRVPGDEDDRDVGAQRDDALAELEAARLRHAEIGEDHVEVARRDLLERVCGRRARRDLHALASEGHLEQLASVALVVDDEDFGLLHLRPLGERFMGECRVLSRCRASTLRRISLARPRSFEAIRLEAAVPATPGNNATAAPRTAATNRRGRRPGPAAVLLSRECACPGPFPPSRRAPRR